MLENEIGVLVFLAVTVVIVTGLVLAFGNYGGPRVLDSRCTESGSFDVLIAFPDHESRWLTVDTDVCKRWENDNR